MNRIAEDNATAHALLALAEGLDFPHLELVIATPENPVLRRLAPIPEFEACWQILTRWMESIASPEERLHQLQTDYYKMFLQPGTNLFLYLHLWYPDESPPVFLSEFQAFLQGTGLTQNLQWFNGKDHLAVIFELLAYMITAHRSEMDSFSLRYFDPWFPTFVNRMSERAPNDFYRAMSAIAQQVSHEWKT